MVDRRKVLYGKLDRAVLGPMLRFGLPFVPSRLALWGLNLSNRLFLLAFSTQAALGVLALGVRIGTSVALVVTAFQLAWPPFAYSIKDDEHAREVYRAALTWWCVLGSWLVLGLALLRHPVLSIFAHRWANAANPMALSEAGYAAYGAYYAVGVAVGRVKKTGLNWVITGIAAIVNMVLCLVMIPFWGPTGAAAATACSYLLAAVLMVWRSERVFAVGYERLRIVWVGAVAGVMFVAADQLPNHGSAIPLRFAIGLVFPLVLFATGWLTPSERQTRARHRGTSGTAALSAEAVVGACGSPRIGPAFANTFSASAANRWRSSDGAVVRTTTQRPKRRAWKPLPSAARNAGSALPLRISATYQPCAIGPCRRSSERTISGPSARAVPRASFSAAFAPGCSTALPQTGS